MVIIFTIISLVAGIGFTTGIILGATESVSGYTLDGLENSDSFQETI